MIQKHLFKAFLILTVVLPENAASQIVNQLPPLYALDFVDSLNGWFVGSEGTVLHTQDGGKLWDILSIGRDDVSLLTVDFISKKEGWVGGQVCCNTGDGIILHTEDGGKTWETQHIEPFNDFRALSFSDSLHGIAGGQGKSLLFTKNGGKIWQRGQPQFPGAFINSVKMIDSLHAWAEGAKIRLVRTFDGGKTWVNADSTYIVGLLLFFADSLHGWIYQEDNILRKTVDGGEKWIQIQSPVLPTGINYYDLFFVDSLRGFISNPNGIFKSADGGETWELITDPVRSALKLFFFNENNGWALGLSGIPHPNIAFTHDGGQTWNIPLITSVQEFDSPTTTPEDFFLHNNYPNPFNPETKISFHVLKANTHLSMSIVSLSGRKIKTLKNDIFQPGLYHIMWNGTDSQNKVVASGLYLCRIRSKNKTQTIKMLLVR